MTKKYDIAVIGLGVMGQSLARNLADSGFNVLCWDRHEEKTMAFIEKFPNKNMSPCKDFKCLKQKMKVPRKYLMMVPAGNPVDEVVKKLTPHLKKGDIVIDGGNSHFRDTIRRTDELKKKGIHFVGMGVSGGEEGALLGPSIMPGGSKESWKAISPILQKISAKDFSGKPCVTYIGTDGAGHYVKMAHNAIEYGIMQMMAESYQILRAGYKLETKEIAKIFKKYSRGRLKSFLFDISVPVLERKDEFKEGYLIDFILDKAGQKGTGRWIALDALERGATLPTSTEAVYARHISAQKDLRVKLAKKYKLTGKKPKIPLQKFVKMLEGALYAGMISSYAQGFDLISTASKEQGWKINLAEVTRIWEGGCIIRADMLGFLHKAFAKAKGRSVHLLEMSDVKKAILKDINSWREVVALGTLHGVAMHGMGSALSYFEDMITASGPSNFIQGLRDNFGAHTYERTDRKGIFHTAWSNLD